MLRTKELFEKKCKRCGKIFRTDKKGAYVCDSCQNENKIANSKKYSKDAPPFTGFTLTQITRIIKRYNREHNTRYSYGRFVNEIYLGRIKGKDLRIKADEY